jgi:hypothetical protein
MTDYNWETIKRQYIQGIKQEDGSRLDPSYEDIVKIHGCSKSSISRHSTDDEDGPWEDQRKRYRNKVNTKTIEKKSEIEAETIVESDLKFEVRGEKLGKAVELKIDECIEIMECKDPENEKYDPNDKRFVKASDFKYLGDGLRDAQETVKVAQGENTANIGVKLMDVDDEERKLIKQLADDLARQK